MSDCALLTDDMAIRKQIIIMIFSKINMLDSLIMATLSQNTIIPLYLNIASEELTVFHLIGPKYSWKFSVDNFLTEKGDTDLQTSLIKSCLSISAEHRLHLWSVNCDETSTNVNTFKNLRCFT